MERAFREVAQEVSMVQTRMGLTTGTSRDTESSDETDRGASEIERVLRQPKVEVLNKKFGALNQDSAS